MQRCSCCLTDQRDEQYGSEVEVDLHKAGICRRLPENYKICSATCWAGATAQHGGAGQRDPELAALDVLPGPERLRRPEPAQSQQPSSLPQRSGADTNAGSTQAQRSIGIANSMPAAVTPPSPAGRAIAPVTGQQTVKDRSAAAASVRK